MNDAERDAWLREALRHAPDNDAAPPSDVSEAILLKARAAARGAATPPRRGDSRQANVNPLTALWDWLARPPVAAGFASVMAATLVGLMWWDRPMDEAMPRSPSVTSDRAPAAPPETRSNATSVAPSTPEPRPLGKAENKGVANDSAAQRRERAAEQPPPGAADARLAEPAAAPARRSADSLAKVRAPATDKKSEAPAPFPSAETQPGRQAPRQALDAAASDEAKRKDTEAGRSRAADELERADVPSSTRPVPPPAENAVAANAKSTAAAPAAATAPPAATSPAPTAAAPATVTGAPVRDRADGLRLQQPQGALGGARQDASGAASTTPLPSTAPAPFRSESERAVSQARSRADSPTRAVAPARVLAAIASDPERWLRQTAGGETIALDAGWRAWLAELDTAAAGRWQPLAAGAPPGVAAGREGATTLRLVNAGRVAAIIRLDDSTVQLDAAPGTGADRWQATLGVVAEQLRSSAQRLSP